MPARRETELPHVLAHGVPPNSAARAKLDMIINDAVVNHRAGVFVFVPLIAPAVLLKPRRIFRGALTRDEMINRNSFELGRGECDRVAQLRIRTPWVNR